jgi:hypothetical protein
MGNTCCTTFFNGTGPTFLNNKPINNELVYEYTQLRLKENSQGRRCVLMDDTKMWCGEVVVLNDPLVKTNYLFASFKFLGEPTSIFSAKQKLDQLLAFFTTIHFEDKLAKAGMKNVNFFEPVEADKSLYGHLYCVMLLNDEQVTELMLKMPDFFKSPSETKIDSK